jgi:integrase
MGRRQFGTTRRLPSGAWQVRYYDQKGERVTAPGTFATKAAAQRWLTLLEADRHRGTYVDPRAGQITFGAWAEEWLTSKPDKRANSIARDRAALRTHLLPAIGSTPVASITPTHVRGVVDAMRRAGLSAKSVRTYMGTLAAIFNAALDADLIARSPVRGFHLETVTRRDRPTVTPVQLFDLAGAMPERFRALVLTAGILGLRWSEVIALTLCDVRLADHSVEVRQTVEEVSGTVRVVPFTKTDASRRTIAIPPLLAEVLECHIAEHRSYASPQDLLFVGSRGGILRRSFLARYFKPACEKVGLPTGRREGIDFHGLRHIATSFMVSTGEHPRVMQHRAGHATPNLTIGLYSHVPEELDRAAAARLQELFEQHRSPRPDSPGGVA